MNAMKAAFASAGIAPKREPVSPWNPSRRAVKRVTNPLPAPTECRFCGGNVEIVKNSEIYNGREYGEWPWAYLCRGCGAYVGMHPFTGIPLGTLADRNTRDMRKMAKDDFNPLWQGGEMTRSEAYSWLADRLGIAVAACHFGWFDADTCERVIEIIEEAKPVLYRR
jgi:hypothetical protein